MVALAAPAMSVSLTAWLINAYTHVLVPVATKLQTLNENHTHNNSLGLCSYM